SNHLRGCSPDFVSAPAIRRKEDPVAVARPARHILVLGRRRWREQLLRSTCRLGDIDGPVAILVLPVDFQLSTVVGPASPTSHALDTFSGSVLVRSIFGGDRNLGAFARTTRRKGTLVSIGREKSVAVVLVRRQRKERLRRTAIVEAPDVSADVAAYVDQ